jgi:hypothetical protein
MRRHTEAGARRGGVDGGRRRRAHGEKPAATILIAGATPLSPRRSKGRSNSQYDDPSRQARSHRGETGGQRRARMGGD